MTSRILSFGLIVAVCTGARADEPAAMRAFNPELDLISLHYDHAPDKDDGHSAAADRTVLQTLHGTEWLAKHVLPVSGAYGKNRKRFNPKSDAVMDAAWNDAGGWIAADRNWDDAVAAVYRRWVETLKAGGDVYVKEGGQSDITAELVRRLRKQQTNIDPRKRVHVVQHSNWNENQTTPTALEYTKTQTDYIRIRDANRYLNRKGGDKEFEQAATKHPRFGAAWQAAFAYYPPRQRLDFSDTGELLHILGLGEIGLKDFQNRFLGDADDAASR